MLRRTGQVLLWTFGPGAGVASKGGHASLPPNMNIHIYNYIYICRIGVAAHEVHCKEKRGSNRGRNAKGMGDSTPAAAAAFSFSSPPSSRRLDLRSGQKKKHDMKCRNLMFSEHLHTGGGFHPQVGRQGSASANHASSSRLSVVPLLSSTRSGGGRREAQ